MFSITNHLSPTSLDQAKMLAAQHPDFKVIAGGTDVLIRLHGGSLEKVGLISLRAVDELHEITRQEDGTIAIGAMASFNKIYRNELVQHYLPALAEAALAMGGPQIRNVATIGGNLCNGAVSADSAPMLFALNARLQIESETGMRLVAIRDFYAGPGKVHLAPGEILTRILLAAQDYENSAGCYIKYSVRKAMDIANLGVAVVCKVKDGSFADLRIALGVAAPVPLRCDEAEAYAMGKATSEEVIQETARLARKAAKARDSWRASKAYREHLIEVLTQRALSAALHRIEGNCCHGRK